LNIEMERDPSIVPTPAPPLKGRGEADAYSGTTVTERRF